MELKEALESLDPLNDDQWTGEGAPKMDVLKELTGNAELQRQDVVDAAPAFTRENPVLEVPDITPEDLSSAVTDENANTNEDDDDNDPPEEPEVLDGEADLSFLGEQKLPSLPKFVESLGDVGEDNLREAEQDIEGHLEELRKSAKMIEQRLKDVAHFKLAVTKRLNVVAPAPTEAESRLAYIRQQNELRAERVARRKELGQINLKELDPRSKLDQAMAARPKRDQKRPTKI